MDTIVLGALIAVGGTAVGTVGTVATNVLSMRGARRLSAEAFDRQMHGEHVRRAWEKRQASFAAVLAFVEYRATLYQHDFIRVWRGTAEAEQEMRHAVLKLEPAAAFNVTKGEFHTVATATARDALDRVDRSCDLLIRRRAERQSVKPGTGDPSE